MIADTINATIRLDRNIKEQAVKINDPFYSVKNQTELSRRIADIESGRATFVFKTMEELEVMADK